MCLREVSMKELLFEHIFSCKVQADKAAFIQRNTEIRLVFCDVREMDSVTRRAPIIGPDPLAAVFEEVFQATSSLGEAVSTPHTMRSSFSEFIRSSARLTGHFGANTSSTQAAGYSHTLILAPSPSACQQSFFFLLFFSIFKHL